MNKQARNNRKQPGEAKRVREGRKDFFQCPKTNAMGQLGRRKKGTEEIEFN